MSDTAWLDQKPSDLDVAQMKIEQLNHEIEQLRGLTTRYQIAYLSMLDVHAALMLSTMTRKNIVDALAGSYAIDLPQDAHTDLRDTLNAEVSARAADNRQSINQEKAA